MNEQLPKDPQLVEGRVNIITHVHTDASTAETSELNDRIRSALHRVAGKDTPIAWSECFTSIETLQEILVRRRGNHGPVHMIMITDHMRSRSHHLPDRHYAAAARNHRFALGAEFATRTRDIDGRYLQGPEILAFGGRNLVQGPHGPYYGLSQQIIDELYDTCLDDEGRELSTRRARDLLLQRGIAHALSHPLDGHPLSLEGTLAIISEFAFIETINGGFSAQSARMLDAFVRLNNALRAGAHLPQEALSPVGRRIVDHIRNHGRTIHPLSGSDAHSHDFDRVVTSMVAPAGRRPEDLVPGELFDRMLSLARASNGSMAPPSPFSGQGQAATLRSLLTDVSAIIMRNARDNFRRCKNPFTWSNIAVNTLFITQDELRWRHQLQRRRIHQLRTHFNPVRLVTLLTNEDLTAAEHPAPQPIALSM
jgi:hypothetical protein